LSGNNDHKIEILGLGFFLQDKMDDYQIDRMKLIARFRDDERTTKLYTEEHKRKIHRAILVKRGKVIAEARNREGNRSLGVGYSERTIHAEKNVVKKLGDLSQLRGADMYVLRHGRNGPHGDNRDGFILSKPCPSCQCFLEKCMREYGLKNVYYTA
jgi:hypothetical protein